MDTPSDGTSTPPRGRGRYPPHLAKDAARVPLHRRGTSRTYERLEDLLREAGYKETRIFTPETEQFAADDDERGSRDGQRKGAGGVGAVVNFLTGFIPGTNASNGSGKAQGTGGSDIVKVVTLDEPEWTPRSPSPSPKTLSSAAGTPSDSMLSSMSSLRPPPPVIRVETASAARASLRHMVSAPNIPRSRHTAAPAPAKQRRVTDQHHTNTEHPPPLPSNWLQSVAKALLLGPTGDHLSAPNHVPRKRTSADALLDATNKAGPSRGRTPHVPCALTTARTITTVTTTSVVCRSAPGSRAASRVRTDNSKSRRHPRPDAVPSLGATTLEDERGRWLTRVDAGLARNTQAPSTRFLHPNANPDPEWDADPESDSDSDAGELDLARLLVPAKRQKSIRSLRKHLQAAQKQAVRRPASVVGLARPARGAVSGSTTPRGDADRDTMSADDSFEAGLAAEVRRGRRGSFDEGDEWASLQRYASGRRNAGDNGRRGALPWTSWAQGRP